MSGYQEHECDKGHRWESLEVGGKCPICFPTVKRLDDGGQAFPSREYNEFGIVSCHNPGMSLRDWFAGQALAGWLADPNIRINDDEDRANVGHNLYKIADAMLLARKQPTN
jgi:hypothetical protein